MFKNVRLEQQNSFHVILLSLGACISLLPYFIWSFQWLALFPVLFAFLFFISRRDLFLDKVDIFLVCIVILFSFYYYMPWAENRASLKGGFFILSSLALLVCFSERDKQRSFLLFRKFFALSLLPGMLIWTLYTLGLDVHLLSIGDISGSNLLNQSKADEGAFYYVFPGSIALNYMVDADLPFFRLCAMYEEPGLVGTVAALFLVASGNASWSKWDNRVILMAGFMSLSLAFFVLFFFHIALNVTRYIKPLLISAICLVICYFFIFSDSSIDAINFFIVDRFKISDGVMAGDNRVNLMLNEQWKLWLNSNAYSLLMGYPEQMPMTGSASWKMIFIYKGIIGIFGFLWVLFLFSVRYYVGFSTICLFLVFVLSLYQRPFVFILPFMLIFIGGLAHLKSCQVISSE